MYLADIMARLRHVGPRGQKWCQIRVDFFKLNFWKFINQFLIIQSYYINEQAMG